MLRFLLIDRFDNQVILWKISLNTKIAAVQPLPGSHAGALEPGGED